jgi:hypothetical protein
MEAGRQIAFRIPPTTHKGVYAWEGFPVGACVWEGGRVCALAKAHPSLVMPILGWIRVETCKSCVMWRVCAHLSNAVMFLCCAVDIPWGLIQAPVHLVALARIATSGVTKSEAERLTDYRFTITVDDLLQGAGVPGSLTRGEGLTETIGADKSFVSST